MVTACRSAVPTTALASRNDCVSRGSPSRRGEATWTAAVMRPFSARAALRWAPPTSHPITTLMFETLSGSCNNPAPQASSAFIPFDERARDMDIVPVVDLKGGRVVRARMGRRRDYQPIHTPLSRTSDPLDVVRGLLSVHPFRSLYIADLDAIEGSGGNSTVLLELRHAFAPMTLWVDNGIA